MKNLDKKIAIIRSVNLSLTILVAVFAFYMVAPFFWSSVAFSFNTNSPSDAIAPLTASINSVPNSMPNKMIIKKIGVDKQIVVVNDIKDVHENIWLRPIGSTPDKGHNSVFLAHRYKKIGGTSASTFFDLPKLTDGDKIQVVWEGKIYNYTVYSTQVVSPTATYVQYPTVDPIITLITCTPLWTADKRLVVRAKLDTELSIR